MKILLTGHKGFIGQNMYKALLHKKFSVDTFDIIDNSELRPKDLPIEGYDWVIHLGAISSTTETNIRKLMDLNLSWSIELLEECNKYNVNMQFASSASVYGLRNANNGPFKTSDECNPANTYAMSKYLFEQYIKSSTHINIVIQCFRYFNVYGSNEEHKGTQASPYTQFKKQAIENGVINIFEGSDSCLRDFIHVDEVIDRQLKYLSIESSGVFNMGTGKTKSFFDVANEIAEEYNASINIVEFPEYLKKHYQYYTCSGID
jgi:ADP-L-glycero-D-manno-heptose 6-epimerase